MRKPYWSVFKLVIALSLTIGGTLVVLNNTSSSSVTAREESKSDDSRGLIKNYQPL
jgi:hypothetical protein